MGYEIEIQHSGGTVTLDANFDWDLQATPQRTAKNVVEYVDVALEAQGQVVAATPGDVADGIKELYELAVLRFQPVTVTVSLDGAEKFKLTPSGSISGPGIADFRTVLAPGNAGSKWEFTLVIFARLPGNNFAGLYDLRTELTVTKNVSGTVIEKLWQAVAKATTIASALAGVMRFKPSGKVSERISRGFDPEPMVSAVWLWRRTTLTHFEEIERIGGGKSYEVDPQAGVNVRPLLHLLRRGAEIVRLNGIVRGLESDSVVAPAAHWHESNTLKRMEALEVKSKPTTASEEDLALGVKSLRYSEVYVNTGDTLPEPNHGSHGPSSTAAIAAPADGAIAR